LDSIAAAAALFMLVGLGIVRDLKGNGKKIGDTVPVDVVVANMIVASAYNFRNPNLPIYHVGSSDRNPHTWGEMKDMVSVYWNSNVSQNRVGKSDLYVTESDSKLRWNRFVKRLPIWMYGAVAPILGKQHVKNVQKMKKTVERGDQIAKIF
jgi:hypothetical protein